MAANNTKHSFSSSIKSSGSSKFSSSIIIVAGVAGVVEGRPAKERKVWPDLTRTWHDGTYTLHICHESCLLCHESCLLCDESGLLCHESCLICHLARRHVYTAHQSQSSFYWPFVSSVSYSVALSLEKQPKYGLQDWVGGRGLGGGGA